MDNKDWITLQKIKGHADVAIRFCKGALSEDFKSRMTEILWNSLNGLRNRIVHGYDDIDYQTIFDTIKNDLLGLSRKIGEIIENQ